MTVMHGQDLVLLSSCEESRRSSAGAVIRGGADFAGERRSVRSFLARLRSFLPGITTPRKSRRALAEGYEVMAARYAARGLEEDARLHREAAEALR